MIFKLEICISYYKYILLNFIVRIQGWNHRSSFDFFLWKIKYYLYMIKILFYLCIVIIEFLLFSISLYQM